MLFHDMQDNLCVHFNNRFIRLTSNLKLNQNYSEYEAYITNAMLAPQFLAECCNFIAVSG